MPARIKRGLSRNGRLRRRGEALGGSDAGEIDLTVAGMTDLLFRVQQSLQLVREFIDVAEMTIHRCKTDIRHFVETLQLLHDKLADVDGTDFFLRPFLESRLHAVGERLERGYADRPFLARLQQTRYYFLPVESLACAVLFDHHIRDLVDPLVTGEALAALEALAAAPDHFAFFRLARIDDFVAEVGTVRAFHTVCPCSASSARRRMPARLRPS